MGKYNSSKYRVVPLIEVVKGNQQNFDIFLSKVHSSKGIPALVCPMENECYYCGDNEKQLKPTKKHLIGLVEYLAENGLLKSDIVSEKRGDLFGKNGKEKQQQAKIEALQRIDEMYDNCVLLKEWYIFEGNTNPDIFIEGDDYIIICEGKWTEPHITTKTTHLNADDEYRNQMVRHIQGALNSTNKKVYAFYIVDADCGYLHDLTEEAFVQQLECETIELSSQEKEIIKQAFYGYATWQELEDSIKGLKFLTKSEIDVLR